MRVSEGMRVRRPWLLAVVLLLSSLAVTACGREAPAERPPWQPGQPLPLPAYAGVAPLRGMTASGTAGDGEVTLEVVLGLGTWREADQTEPLLLTYGQSFSGFWLGCGYTLSAARLQVVWLYCRGDRLEYVWTADTAGGRIRLRPASGSCVQEEATTDVAFALPAIALPLPPVLDGFSLESEQIRLGPPRPDGSSGEVRIDGRWMPAWVFSVIDCSTCDVGGWWELHTLIWDDASSRLLSQIYYLDTDLPSYVAASWGFWLPDLEAVKPIELPAVWTVTGSFPHD